MKKELLVEFFTWLSSNHTLTELKEFDTERLVDLFLTETDKKVELDNKHLNNYESVKYRNYQDGM